jgi:hypothetical protein
MAAHYPVPIQEDIRDLFMDLLDRGAAVDKVSRLELEEDQVGAVFEYVNAEGEVGALCLVDGPMVNRAGAALSMVPVVVAEESVKKERIADHLLENFREIVNIMSRLLNSSRTPHLRLSEVHTVPGELPPPVAALLVAPEFRRDFAVTIEGYGSGRLSLLVA